MYIFLKRHFFTTSFSLIKLGTNLSTSNLSTLHFKLLKLLSTIFNLSIFNLSTSDFKIAKLVLWQNPMYQHLLHFLNLLCCIIR